MLEIHKMVTLNHLWRRFIAKICLETKGSDSIAECLIDNFKTMCRRVATARMTMLVPLPPNLVYSGLNYHT